MAFVLQVDPHPDGPAQHALIHVVARIGWAAALVGNSQLAEQCARRASVSQVSCDELAVCWIAGINVQSIDAQHITVDGLQLTSYSHVFFS
jgi:hypothetical protein